MSENDTVRLEGLQTELRNPRSVGIDNLSTLELCSVFNQEDSTVHHAVEACTQSIAKVVDVVSDRMRRGGRLFYIGAGTSGRLGVLDASEIPPTYSAAPDQFVALVAGGDYALRHAKEGAEDDRLGAEQDLKPYNLDPKVDSLVGIATSGRTPYVLGGLSYAKRLGCETIGLVCVEPSEVADEGNADHLIAVVTGPEVVTGSTRMKAGTATKLVLNMISTGIMIKLGKTYGNLMVDLRATNLKLRQRARNVLRAVVGSACTKSDEELDGVLDACRGSVKLACVCLMLGLPPATAEERLRQHYGVLARVLDGAAPKILPISHSPKPLVLCVDAGGSSCKAVIMSENGQLGHGSSGPCNVSTIAVESAITSIIAAVNMALHDHPLTKGQSIETARFTSAWIALAGYGRRAIQPQVDKSLSSLLRLPAGDGLTVTTDIDLLPASVASDPDIDSVIVLVAGTGSIAMRYQRHNDTFVRTGRAGGWGHLLGDDGSGYCLGRNAARLTLEAADVHCSAHPRSDGLSSFSPLAAAVLQHLQSSDPTCRPDDVLSALLCMGAGQGSTSTSPTRSIAELATIVLSMAQAKDDEATSIVDAGVASLAKMVALLAHGDALDLSRTALVLGGGLMQNDHYRSKVVDLHRQQLRVFAHIELVTMPALEGARQLLTTCSCTSTRG